MCRKSGRGGGGTLTIPFELAVMETSNMIKMKLYVKARLICQGYKSQDADFIFGKLNRL